MLRIGDGDEKSIQSDQSLNKFKRNVEEPVRPAIQRPKLEKRDLGHTDDNEYIDPSIPIERLDIDPEENFGLGLTLKEWLRLPLDEMVLEEKKITEETIRSWDTHDSDKFRRKLGRRALDELQEQNDEDTDIMDTKSSLWKRSKQSQPGEKQIMPNKKQPIQIPEKQAMANNKQPTKKKEPTNTLNKGVTNSNNREPEQIPGVIKQLVVETLKIGSDKEFGNNGVSRYVKLFNDEKWNDQWYLVRDFVI